MTVIFKKYLSEARIKAFEVIDSENPKQIYFANVALCEAFYTSIHFLEIILRNKITKAVAIVAGEDWLKVDKSVIIDNFELENLKKSRQNLLKINKELSSDNIIAELNFGFWVSFFHKKYESKIWQKKRILQNVFPNFRNSGLLLNVKKIRADLEIIRKLRNRIFHHEPIISSVPSLQLAHQLMYLYIKSMAPELVEEILQSDRFLQYCAEDNVLGKMAMRARLQGSLGSVGSQEFLKNLKIKIESKKL